LFGEGRYSGDKKGDHLRPYVPFVSAGVAFLCATAVCATAVGQENLVIRQIRVEGCVHSTPQQVREAIGVQEDSRLDAADTRDQIGDDIRNVYSLDFVGDVTVVAEQISDGVKLVFMIDENPLITDIRFEGLKRFDTDDLQRELGFKKPKWIWGREVQRMYYSPQTAAKMRRQLLDFYAEKAFPNTVISYEWEQTGDKEGILTFTVKEGRKLKVHQVRFEGATALEHRFLQKQIRTRKGWWFFKRSFEDEEFELDLLRIEHVYKEHGYLNVKATRGTFDVTPDGKGLVVVINVEEGAQFRVAKVEPQGNAIFTQQEVLDVVQTATGEVCNWTTFNDDLRRLSDLYRGQGFLRSFVDYRMVQREQEGLVDLTFLIHEGSRIYLGDIVIRSVATIGAKGDIEPVELKTKDYVILREIRLESGEVLDWDEVRAAERRLINLRFFQQDEEAPMGDRRLLYGFSNRRTKDANIDDLVLTVEEAPTGTITFGVGYNTTFGPSVFTEITEMNLFGRGQRGRLFAQLGEKRNQGKISWTEPRFLGSDYLVGVEAYYLDRDPYGGVDFNERRVGGSVRVGKQLSDTVSAWARYKLERVEISEIEDPDEFIVKRPELFEEQTLTTSSITFGVRRDTRDYFLNPTSGTDMSFSTEFAGLGGNNDFAKIMAEASWYYQLAPKLVLALNGQLGAAFTYDDDDLPLQERFFLGGANSVRGFDEGGIGPREEFIRGFLDEAGVPIVDPETGLLDLDRDMVNIGGEAFSEGHLELRYRLVQNLDLVTFLDAGTAVEEARHIFNDMRLSTGFGIRFTVPVFGAGAAIRLDYGIPLIEEEYDETETIHFSFGHQF
jgi:outer membrane protein insertion porin family